MNQLLSDVILKNLLDGVLIVDGEGRIIYANQAAEKLFGKAATDLIGEPFGYPIVDKVQEIQLFCAGQILTVEILASIIQWNGVEACLLSFHDITELKRISKELEAQQLRLQNINAELQQYASLASHDLKEPVRKIMLFTERLLVEDEQPADELKNQLAKIYHSANRLKFLISGIAEYSRCLEPADKAPVNLNEVVKEVITDLEVMIAEKNAKIDWESLPVVEGVEIQMHQLFLNLISNAIKYARNGIKPLINISNKENDGCFEITVKDNGIGFDSDNADEIFQPFRRLHTAERYDGSGIGLTICKKIVQAHGGEIRVESKKGEGSSFVFTLAKQ